MLLIITKCCWLTRYPRKPDFFLLSITQPDRAWFFCSAKFSLEIISAFRAALPLRNIQTQTPACVFVGRPLIVTERPLEEPETELWMWHLALMQVSEMWNLDVKWCYLSRNNVTVRQMIQCLLLNTKTTRRDCSYFLCLLCSLWAAGGDVAASIPLHVHMSKLTVQTPPGGCVCKVFFVVGTGPFDRLTLFV